MVRSYSETYSNYAAVEGDNSSAGAEIVSVTAPDTGLYKVQVYHKVNAASSPALLDNLVVQLNDIVLIRIQHIAAVSNSTALDTDSPLCLYVRAWEGDTISVNYLANFGAAETQTHAVTLAITRMAD